MGMSKRLLHLIVAGWMLLGLSYTQAGQERLLDEIVAVVNDSPITMIDIERYLRFNLAAKGANWQARFSRRELLSGLSQYLNRRLLIQEIDKLLFEPERSESDEQMVAQFKRGFRTQEEARLFMESVGFSEKEILEYLKNQIRLEQFIRKRARIFATVSGEEIEERMKRMTLRQVILPDELAELRRSIQTRMQAEKLREYVETWLGELRSRNSIIIQEGWQIDTASDQEQSGRNR